MSLLNLITNTNPVSSHLNMWQYDNVPKILNNFYDTIPKSRNKTTDLDNWLISLATWTNDRNACFETDPLQVSLFSFQVVCTGPGLPYVHLVENAADKFQWLKHLSWSNEQNVRLGKHKLSHCPSPVSCVEMFDHLPMKAASLFVSNLSHITRQCSLISSSISHSPKPTPLRPWPAHKHTLCRLHPQYSNPFRSI